MNEYSLSTRTHDLARRVLDACKGAGLRVSTAESCTGGLVAASLTEIAGSSQVVDRAFVTYNDKAKHDMLGVGTELLERVGAVSSEVACAMAEGALAHSRADLAVSVTGIAGPGGAEEGKPVGLVFVGVARTGATSSAERRVLPGDRHAVRSAALVWALETLLAHTG
jgi:nicotinamide-nucleotide amidase